MKKTTVEKKINIIFTGLFRQQELLKKSIANFIKLRKDNLVDKIIVSTWDYEVKKNPKMTDFLKNNEVIVLGSKEPKKRGFGNINCQMKALEAGLREVNKKSFVLKTRTDIYIDPLFLKGLFKNKERILRIKLNLPDNVFRYKFWIPYFEITKPFYLSDEAYFGYYEDHKKLINYKPYHDSYNLQSGTIHMQRWFEPFLSKYPVLKDFIENHPHVGYPKENLFYKIIKKIAKQNRLTFNLLNSVTVRNRFRVLKKRLEDERYVNVLAAYYSILYSHFYINAKPVDYAINKEGIFKRGSPFNPKVNNLDLIKNYVMENATGKRQGQIYAYNDEFLKNIFNGKIIKDDFSTSLLVSIDKFFNRNLLEKRVK